jgi:nucleoside-diphosphate-sugar epimerase
VAADVETVDGAAKAVAGASVVYMAAQPPYTDWPGRFPTMLAKVIDATAEAGAKLVMVDNLYGYGPLDGPMSESTPELATDRKGVVRREMTEMLLEAHRSRSLRVAIGRASDYYGPDCENSGVAALAIIPATNGKTIRWLVRGDVPHSVAYLPDVARAYVTLGTDQRADGEIWHLPHGAAVTGAQFLDVVRNAAGTPLKTGVVTKFMLWIAAPFHAISRESLGILHQWDRPFVVDDSKFRTTFGDFENTPLEEAVAESLRSYGASVTADR